MIPRKTTLLNPLAVGSRNDPRAFSRPGPLISKQPVQRLTRARTGGRKPVCGYPGYLRGRLLQAITHF